jgi:hypothetical protein
MQLASVAQPNAHAAAVSQPRARYVIWKNVFALYDDGALTGDDYKIFEDAFIPHAARYPKTAAVMTVLPHGTRPPSEHTRRAIVSTYDRLSHLIRSIVWVVEGSGFNSAMVRATLTTIGLARRKYHACSITSSIEEGLAVLITQSGLADTTKNAIDLAAGVAALEVMRPTADVPAPPQSETTVTKRRWPWSTER